MKTQKIKGINIFGIVLAVILVFTMLPISNWQVQASDMVTVKLHYRNAESWSEVYVYAWNPDELTNSWPGNKVSIDGDGYYTYEFKVSSDTDFNYIFNNGGSEKTRDNIISSSKLSTDEDGVVERWLNGKSTVYTGALSMSGTSVNGNEVTFKAYTYADVGNVYLIGTMNGWSTNSDEMQKSGSDKYTYTMTLEPGEYEYKFYWADYGLYYRDSQNHFMRKEGDDYNSILYVSGIITTSLNIEKDDLIELPTELEYLKSNGGHVTKAVTYTSETLGVTINGNAVTLADDFTANEFTVTATTADGESRRVNVSLYEADDVTVEIHYDRADNKESEWDVWLWADNQDGQAIQFEEVDGEYIATYTVSEEDVPFINALKYKIKKGEWEDEEEERQIDLSNVVAGKVCSYVYSDGTYSNSTTEAVMGTKLKSVEYNISNNTIVVDASGLVTNPNTDFIIKKANGTVINITDIVIVGTTYYISIGEDLTSLFMSIGSYELTYDYNGAEYSVKIPGLYNSDELVAGDGDDTGTDTDTSGAVNPNTGEGYLPIAHAAVVKICKTDITGEYELKGATLSVYDINENLIETWVSDGYPHYIERLPVGKYVLREEAAPKGYLVAADVEFEVTETYEIQEVYMVGDVRKGQVIINKIDVYTGEVLSGVEFEIRDEDGNVIETLVTDENGYAKSQLLDIAYFENGEYKVDRKYYLVETKAKEGYLHDETVYEIVFDGKEDEEVIEVVFDLINRPDIPYIPSISPKTGDSSKIVLFGILGLISLLLIVGLTLGKKKRTI